MEYDAEEVPHTFDKLRTSKATMELRLIAEARVTSIYLAIGKRASQITSSQRKVIRLGKSQPMNLHTGLLSNG